MLKYRRIMILRENEQIKKMHIFSLARGTSIIAWLPLSPYRSPFLVGCWGGKLIGKLISEAIEQIFIGLVFGGSYVCGSHRSSGRCLHGGTR